MTCRISSALVLLLGLALATPPGAADSRLVALATGDDGGAWEAVGRLDIGTRAFCTGTLIAPDLVLTAAHCLHDRQTGARVDPAGIAFLAGWRHGRAAAERRVRRAVIHPGFRPGAAPGETSLRHDLALLELQHPIRNARIRPFPTGREPQAGQQVGVVSYAAGRSEAPSLQELCTVRARRLGVLVMSCDVDFGASGAPVFSFEGGAPRIVSVVSAMAEAGGEKVSLGTELQAPLDLLRAALGRGQGVFQPPAPQMSRSGIRREIGAKFARPDGREGG